MSYLQLLLLSTCAGAAYLASRALVPDACRSQRAISRIGTFNLPLSWINRIHRSRRNGSGAAIRPIGMARKFFDDAIDGKPLNPVGIKRQFRGLSEADVATRLKAEGHNELPQPNRRTPFRIAIEVLREPMLALLLVGGIIYLALGDLKEAIILVAFATMSIVITVVQETRTERVLEALRDLTSPRALVIRDGKRKRIAGRTSCGAI